MFPNQHFPHLGWHPSTVANSPDLNVSLSCTLQKDIAQTISQHFATAIGTNDHRTKMRTRTNVRTATEIATEMLATAMKWLRSSFFRCSVSSISSISCSFIPPTCCHRHFICLLISSLVCLSLLLVCCNFYFTHFNLLRGWTFLHRINRHKDSALKS